MDARRLQMSEIHADDTFNCRGVIEELDVVDLAKDIKDKGLLQPVVVTPYTDEKARTTGKKYLLIAGYRRFRACTVAGLTEIDAVVRHNIGEIQARVFNLSENLNRKDLDILQEAKALAHLSMFGVTRDEIAKQVNKSPGWVQVRQMLLSLPEPLQNEAKIGSINQSEIRHLYTLHNATCGDDKSVIEEFKRIRDKKITGHAARKYDPVKVKPETKVVRTRTDVIRMLDHMQEWLPNGLWSRCLAWCAGEIPNSELYESAKEFADELGRPYRPPEEL